MRAVGDSVTLACAPWSGVVEKVHSNGRVDIALDDGGKAWGMAQDEVKDTEQDEDVAAREKRATADKSWPPKTMEQKVPDQRGQK